MYLYICFTYLAYVYYLVLVNLNLPYGLICGDGQVYILVRNQMQEDHEDAWKKLFVVAFVAIIVATVSLQVGLGP